MNRTDLYVLILIIAFLGSVILEMMILPRVIYISKRKRLFDVPNSRKKHGHSTPRLGGITFMPVIVMVTLFLLFVRRLLGLWSETLLEKTFPELLLFVCGLFVIYLLGAKDDLVGVDFKKKFIIQFIASLFIVGSGIYINNLGGLFGLYEIPDAFGITLSVLIIIFTINAINLIDGADGLASGLSAVALCVYGFIFFQLHMWTYASIAFIALGMLVPFFYYNFFHPTRKIFMGDTGSLTLGYILAFMLLRLANTSLVPTETVPSGLILLLVTAVFIPLFDALRVMIVRILTKRPPFSPDRNHIHHKIIDLGFSIKKTVSSIVLVSILLIALNWTLLSVIDCNIVLLIDLFLAFSVSMLLVEFTKRKKTKEKEIIVEQQNQQ